MFPLFGKYSCRHLWNRTLIQNRSDWNDAGICFNIKFHFCCFLLILSFILDDLKQFTNEAFDFIIKNCSNVENIDELRKHPDTLDDFFRLSLRFLQRCPLEFIESPIFTPIMTLAVTSLNIDHRDANLSITKFLSEFIAYSHKPQIKVSAF